MNLNEIKIKLSGIASIPKELNLSKTYGLEISKAEIRKIEDITNDNGTFDRVFKITISPYSEVLIKSEKEKILGKKKGSQSQVLRNIIRKLWEQQYSGLMTEEEFYQQELSNTINCYKDQLD